MRNTSPLDTQLANHFDMIRVLPINKEMLIKLLMAKRPIGEHDNYLIPEEALVVGTGIITDTEAIHYGELDHLVSIGIELSETTSIMFELGVRVEKFAGETENGGKKYIVPMVNEFILSLPVSFFYQNDLFLPEVSMREFMDSRFMYNPRIINNMHQLSNSVNKYIKK